MPDISHNLPPDLEALHRELEALDIDERPSFGPELERELEIELRSMRTRSAGHSGGRRWAMAASIGGVLALGAVPGVRASLVRAFDAAMANVRSVDVRQATVDLPPARVSVLAEEPPQTARVFVPMEESPERPEAPASWANESIETIAPEFAYPVLLDPADAERIVQMFYPRRLQEQGVGGQVQVMIWVDENGLPTDREIVNKSGVEALDRAAVSAISRLRFQAARRGGAPVGSWVKFTIRFEPSERTGAQDPGTIQESEGVVVDTRSGAVAGRGN